MRKLSLSTFKQNAMIELKKEEKVQLRGGMKRFEELRSQDDSQPGNGGLADADSETFDR